MQNKLLNLAYKELTKKKYSGIYFSLSNENLYEFTLPIDNLIYEFTGFTGDTGSLLITKNKSYLYIDGRFVIQAKKEIKDKSIIVVEVERKSDIIDDLLSRLPVKSVLAINPKIESAKFVLSLIEKLNGNNIKLSLDDKFLNAEIIDIKKHYFNMSSAPLFLLNKKYVSLSTKQKIKKLLNDIKEQNNNIRDCFYLTSNLEEIAYLSNLRYRLCDIDNHGVLFKSFMLVGDNKSTLYTNDYLEDEANKYIKNNGVIVKKYYEFYKDIKSFKYKNRIYFDSRINNYYIYKSLNFNNVIMSPLFVGMSIKGNIEIDNIKKCNIIDGVAMVKSIYAIKQSLNSTKSIFKTEYDIKKYVDNKRKSISRRTFLCPSFETIVAYKENSAICHYIPKINNSKRIKKNSLLLIDSGGNYLNGTTDITRTISLYSDKKNIPNIIKKHYTLVLNSMLNLSMLKFPFGLTGNEIDIIARKNLYNEFIDFNHGTGHGIGYISNVHEGPNRIGPGFNNSDVNVLQRGQITSNEPGIYIEGKYGIRIENDLLTVQIKQNSYGEFLGFETLTLCPYDRDLIDKKYLDETSIVFLNSYNKLVYKKLSKYLNNEERKWLMKETKEV